MNGRFAVITNNHTQFFHTDNIKWKMSAVSVFNVV